jgi:hypothetical protein
VCIAAPWVVVGEVLFEAGGAGEDGFGDEGCGAFGVRVCKSGGEEEGCGGEEVHCEIGGWCMLGS